MKKRNYSVTVIYIIAGLLTVATIGGVAAGLTSCEHSVGSGTGGGGQQDQGSWGAPVWSGNITWIYVTDEESTEFIPGTGHKEGIEQGTETHTNGNTRPVTRKVEDPNKEIILIPAKKILDPVTGAFKDREKEDDDNKGKVPEYDPENKVEEVDLVDIIDEWNSGYDNRVHNSLNGGDAADVIRDISPKLRDQAEALRAFFDAAEDNFKDSTDYPVLSAKFTALKNAETAIKTALGAGSAVKDRPDSLELIKTAILTGIFDNTGTSARDDFDKYFDPYVMGHYVVSRDWGTEPTGNRTALGNYETDFANLLGVINEITTVIDSGGSIGCQLRGDTNVMIAKGSSSSQARMKFDALGIRLEDQMVARIVDAWGLSGLAGQERTNANEMAKALVIQLGQDHQEFRAFIDDLEKEQTNHSVDYSQVLNSTNIAQAGTQSNVKLASVDAAANAGGVSLIYRLTGLSA